MKLIDLAPTQQDALNDALRAPLNRKPGGYTNRTDGERIHTVRCINALERNGLIERSQLGSVVYITTKGHMLFIQADNRSVAA